MFDRFTDRARRVLVLAQEEARLLDHSYIGTEHLLLGLLREGEGPAAHVLDALGISLETARARVEETVGHPDAEPSGQIQFTRRAKKVLELSLREAIQLGLSYIATEHILLGIIHEGEGVAAQVLVQLDADLPQLRQDVVRLVTGPAEERGGMLDTLTEGPPAVTLILPARCSFCGTASPECGTLFTGAAAAALICERCLRVGADLARQVTTTRAGPVSPVRGGLRAQPLRFIETNVDDLGASTEASGPQPDDEE